MERDGVKGRIIIIKKIEVFVCVCVCVYSILSRRLLLSEPDKKIDIRFEVLFRQT